MDIEAVAFRAVMYMELWRLRYTSPTAYAEHLEEMSGPTGSLALAFIDTLTTLDWLAVNVMDERDADPTAMACGLAVLSIRSPQRFEATLHALVIDPPEDEWCEPIANRWQEVEQAMNSFGFWMRKADDLRRASREDIAALREALDDWPPLGQDPSVSARHFETALTKAINGFLPPHRQKVAQ
jgi:hypothetical protein